MKIAGLALALPSLRLSNLDVLNMIGRRNAAAPREAVEAYCRTVSAVLESLGAQTRYLRDPDLGERASGLIVDAISNCLSQASVDPSEIDLVIYCGVGRGLVEPSNAAFVCKLAGLSCDNFDIAEACMSWARALNVAQAFLQARRYAKILVVNGEFNASRERLDFSLKMKGDAEFGYSFAALTIGEAATATLLVASQDEWSFQFVADPAKADLCTIPSSGIEEFYPHNARVGLNGVDHLVSHGPEMFAAARRAMMALARENRDLLESCALIVPHTPAAEIYAGPAAKLNLSGKVYTAAFTRLGNVVSASIPAGLRLAIDEGRLRPGDRFVLFPASAGMSFALISSVL